MLELIAQGPTVDTRWRRPLGDTSVVLGRTSAPFRTPWDSQISRRHVRMELSDGKLQVEKIEAASNPVFFYGKSETSFLVAPNEHFVIGETTFTLVAERAFVSLEAPDPISQKTFSAEFLERVIYRDADLRIQVLNRLPEIISSAGKTDDLLIRIINTLFSGINAASTIGFVRSQVECQSPGEGAHQPVQADLKTFTTDGIEIIQWDRRGLGRGDFQPSATLIRQAIGSGETILNVWNQAEPDQSNSTAYTCDYENDWAFVCPISSPASSGWGIYVAGTNRRDTSLENHLVQEPDLQGDMKFCELVGSTLKNLLLVKQLERQQASLGSFFSPIVLNALSHRDPEEVLAPRKCDVSVLFCDLRGFAKASERMADQLLELLARVSDSLGVVTQKILGQGGVIGDFHGDAAMGFWGWPLEGGNIDANAVHAVTSALEIQNDFEASLETTPDLPNFQIGLGIASGKAVAGKIGSQDQVKVTAFGPIVNLASRLEGMTRWIHPGILTEIETVNRLKRYQGSAPPPVTRRLGNFQPFGMTSSLDVFQVIPQEAAKGKCLLDYEEALSFFESGAWNQAIQILKRMPPDDSARRFLERFIGENGNEPPQDWLGCIKMRLK